MGETFAVAQTILYVEPLGSCGGNSPCYSTVQEAVDDAVSGGIIRIAKGRYDEDLDLDLSENVTLEGGWDASFAARSATPGSSTDSSVNGTMTLSDDEGGAVILDDVVIETVVIQDYPPTVNTGSATSVTETSATLNGTVNPNGSSTTYYFQYGTTTSYGENTSSTSAGSGTSNVSAIEPVSGLTCNTTYHYRLVATNSWGTSNGSDKTFTTSSCAVILPTVTTGETGWRNDIAAILNGTVNPNESSTTYYFQYGTTTSYGNITARFSVGSGSSSIPTSTLVFGLSTDTTYHCRLVAYNSGGTSYGSDKTFSNYWNFSLQASSPLSPLDLPTSVTDSSATLNGTVNPNEEITEYYFEYGTTTSYGALTSATSAGSGSSSISASTLVTGLSKSTTYHYRLLATTKSGQLEFGSDETFTTSSSAVIPPTVTTGSPTSVTDIAAILNGTVNPNGSSTTYYFQYGTTTSYGENTSSTSAGSGTSNVSANTLVSGLTSNTTYHYRLVATNSGGTSYGGDKTFTTSFFVIPPTVTTGSATMMSDYTFTLNGNVNPNGSSTTYQFQYGATASYGQNTASISVGSGSSSISASAPVTFGLSNTTYHYRLVATNSGGTSYGGDKTLFTGPY